MWHNQIWVTITGDLNSFENQLIIEIHRLFDETGQEIVSMPSRIPLGNGHALFILRLQPVNKDSDLTSFLVGFL